MTAAAPSAATTIFGTNSVELPAATHQQQQIPPPQLPSISSHSFPPPPPNSCLLFPTHSSQSSSSSPAVPQICGLLNSVPINSMVPNSALPPPPHFLLHFEEHSAANLALAAEQNSRFGGGGPFPTSFGGFGCANIGGGDDPSQFGHLMVGGNSSLFFPSQSSPGDHHLLLMGGTGPSSLGIGQQLMIPGDQFPFELNAQNQQHHFLIQQMTTPPPTSSMPANSPNQHRPPQQFLLQLAPKQNDGNVQLISPPNEPNGGGDIEFPSQCGIGQQNTTAMEIGVGIIPRPPLMQMPRSIPSIGTPKMLPNRRQVHQQQPRMRRRERIGNLGRKRGGMPLSENGQKHQEKNPIEGNEIIHLSYLELEGGEKSDSHGLSKSQQQILNNFDNERMPSMPLPNNNNNNFPITTDSSSTDPLIIPLPTSSNDPSTSSILSIETPPITSTNGFDTNLPHRCGHCGEEIHEKEMLKLGMKKKMIGTNSTTNEPTIPTLQIINEEKEQQQMQQEYFHLNCLKCSECEDPLEMAPKCFMRNGLIFCPQCYAKSFVLYCATCEKQIEPTVWFRRARNLIYHLVCLRCEHCQRQLNTGEQFALDDTTQHHSQVLGQNIPRLLCKQHYMELVRGEQCSPKPKAKRVRTTFEENQLAILQEHFKVDSNPDGADLERIAQLTGLTKRVTQVWFQNSRARQKKYHGHGGSGNGTNGGNGTSRKLPSGGPCSSSNSNNSSTVGLGGIDGLCRSLSGTPDSSTGDFGIFGGGNESEENANGNDGGNGGTTHQQDENYGQRRRLFSTDSAPKELEGENDEEDLRRSMLNDD